MSFFGNSFGSNGTSSNHGRKRNNKHDVINKDILNHLQVMGEMLDTLERRSEKMRKWRKNSKLRQKGVTPTKLNFDSDNDDEEKVDYEPSAKEE